jgi:hypothetical protein
VEVKSLNAICIKGFMWDLRDQEENQTENGSEIWI